MGQNMQDGQVCRPNHHFKKKQINKILSITIISLKDIWNFMAKYLTTRFGKLKDARKPILGKWSNHQTLPRTISTSWFNVNIRIIDIGEVKLEDASILA